MNGAEVKHGYANRNSVLTLVEPGNGRRSFRVRAPAVANLLPIIKANVASGAHVMTDKAGQHTHLGEFVTENDFTNHGKARCVPGVVDTNTVEGFYGVSERGIKGIYKRCNEKNLHRYVSEFDFRYNQHARLEFSDLARTNATLSGISAKSMTYRDSSI